MTASRTGSQLDRLVGLYHEPRDTRWGRRRSWQSCAAINWMHKRLLALTEAELQAADIARQPRRSKHEPARQDCNGDGAGGPFRRWPNWWSGAAMTKQPAPMTAVWPSLK